MFFCRQTFLLVCLVLPLSLFAQPVANDDNATVNEDESITIDLVVNDTPGADPSTVDLDPSTTDEEKSISTSAGSFSVNDSGILEFTPSPDFDEEAVITYTVKDATLMPSDPATVTITVTPVNDPPTISQIGNTSVNQDATTPDIPFEIADVDNDFSDLIVSAVSSDLTLIPASGIALGGSNGDRTITITPAAGESGTATITVTVNDGEFDVAEAFDIEVIAAPAAPPVIAVSDPITTLEDTPSDPITITVTDADTPVGNLTLTATSANTTLIPAANISLEQESPGIWKLSVTPAPDQYGTTQINLLAADGTGNTQSGVVSVTVTPVNDVPTISAIADQTIPQGGTTGPISFTIDDKDGFAGVTVQAASNNAALVLPGGIVLGGSNGNRTITVTPISSASGTATITVTVRDAGPTPAIETFLLTVTDIPDPPVITATTNITTTEDFTSAGVPFTVADPDTDPGLISVLAVSGNEALIPTANIQVVHLSGNNWTVAATPAPNANGSTTITLTASDGALTGTATISATVVAVNDAPTITTVAPVTTAEDVASATRSFAVGDVETAAGSLTVSTESGNTTLIPNDNVILTNMGAGSWSVQVMPAPNQYGSATITLRVSDGTTSTTTPLAVTVTPVNDLPTITTITNQSINQNTSTPPLNFTISDAETDPASLTVTASSGNTDLVPLGNIAFGGSGSNRNVTVTPVPGLFGTSLITLTVTDADEGEVQTSFQLTVIEVNAPPFFVTTITDRTIDEDGATGSLSFEVGDPNTPVNTLIVTGTSSNTALVDAGGIAIGGSGANRNVTVTPNINANGITNVTLRVSDGVLFAETSFVLTVNAVNDPPTITSIAPQNIDENGSTGALGFTINDLETAPALLTMSSLSSNPNLADNAEIIFGGGGSSRSVNVIPKINRSGVATITLTVTDANGGTAQTAFLLTVAAVDAPPTISSIDDLSIDEDTPSGAIPFTVGDIDVPAEDLTVTGSSSNASVVAAGGIALVETGPGTWTVQITPVLNAFGSSLITLTVDDGTETTSETFTVTVNSINDLPTITPVIPTQNINEDSNTGAIGFAISDVETAVGSLTVTASSSNATLVPPGGIAIGGTGGSRTITVTPVPDGFGSADITILVRDANGGESTRTFTVNVAPINDTPTISSIATQNIDEDQAGGTGDISFTVGDVEAGTLTVEGASSSQAIVPDANITITGSGTARTVRVVPAPNAFGTALITLTVTDEEGLFATSAFNVIVASVNDLPTISTPPDQTIDENASTGAIPFTIGDVETATTALTVTRTTSNAALIPLANVVLGGSGANRTVTVSPLASQSGTATITLTVTDGTTPVSTSFNVTVTAVEDPPVISVIADRSVDEDNVTPAIPFTISDPDTPVGSLGVTAASDNQSLVPDANVVLGGSGASRSVTVTPLPNQNGTTTITITVTDGTNVVNEQFVLTVNPVNDAPTITAIANQTTNEDTPTGNIGFTVADLETAASALVVSATSDNTALVPNAPANLVLGGTAASRTIQVVPATNASGTANITVTVNDGTTSATRTFSVTVSPINDAPTISAIADQTVTEDAATGAIPFTIGDEETPGTLVVTASSSNTTLVPVANVVLGGSGANRTVTITPALNQFGTATISITVDDATTTTVRDFILTVTPVDDPPTISAIANRTINEDVSTGNISFTISDPETSASALTVTGVSSNTVLVPNSNIVLAGTTGTRTVNITPALNENGTTNITLTVSDGAHSVDRVFTVNVTPVNDLPVVTGQEPIAVNEGQPVTLNFVLLHVFDPDNTQAELTLLPTGGANYSLTGPTTITPNPSYNGPLTVPVLVSDGNGVGPLFNVAITVISTNDPPVITGQDPIAMNEDQTLVLQVTDFNVTDPDSDPSNFSLTILPGTNYTVGSGNAITPSLNFNGSLTVIVKVSDGQAESAPYNALVTVNPVNDPPTITAQTTISTNEETPLLLLIGQFTVVDPEPTSYTLTVMPAAADAPYTTNGNEITPKTDVTGTITVPVRASDGQANSAVFNAQVNVIPVNDPPSIIGQTALNTVEDVPITIKLANLDVVDVDNTYPTGFSLAVLPGTNYTFTSVSSSEFVITPSLDFTGDLQVNVQVNDGLANSNVYLLHITVTDDADAPVIRGPKAPLSFNEDTRGTVTLAHLDWVDADTPAADIVVSILPGTNYTFQNADVIPVPNFFGTLTVNVRLYDGEAYSNTFPLQVTVNPVDDPPFFNPIATITVFEDAPQQTFAITGISPGPMESQTMNLFFTVDNPAIIPAPQSQTLGPTTTSTTVSYKPNLNQSGTVIMGVTLLDVAPGFSRNVIINVTPVNDPPSMNVVSTWTMEEGTPEQSIELKDLSPGGGAPEADQALSFIVSTDNEELFEIVPNVSYQPNQPTALLLFKAHENAFGTAHITVRLQDSGAASPAPNVNFTEYTITLEITPVNDPPIIVSTPERLAEPGLPYQYELIATDADNDELTITVSSLPSWLSVVQGANGHAVFSGVPPSSESGKSVHLSIMVTDEAGVSVDASYDLSLNSRPVLVNINMAVAEDTPLPLTSNDFERGFDDPDGNPLAVLQIISLPEHGKLSTSAGLVTAGMTLPAGEISGLTYQPDQDYHGNDSFLWTGADGFGVYPEDEGGALVSIQINPVNDPPVITMEAETDTLKYELGSEDKVRLTRTFDCWDPDGEPIRSAVIAFQQIGGFQYRPENDLLIFAGAPNITGEFKEGGVLVLEGAASHAEYDSAITNILYQYVNARQLLLDLRSVSIQVSDGVANSNQPSRTIQLIYTFEDLKIPSAFSPNEGDNVNNTWSITSDKGEDLYADAEIKVYNKNGLLLFETRGLNDPWTGIYNGALLPTDTYYYTIDLHYNKVRYKGAVTLLR